MPQKELDLLLEIVNDYKNMYKILQSQNHPPEQMNHIQRKISLLSDLHKYVTAEAPK